MDSLKDFTHKSLITAPYTLTYSYYLSPNFHEITSTNPSLPVVMLIHGFPDSAHMWSLALPKLQTLGYPLVIPDLLGFGGSSKPIPPHLYNYKQQADSLAQVLDAEGITTRRVIPVGHDWGSATAQRFYLYHRDRCIGLSLLSLAYQVPSTEPFDLEKVNQMTANRFGYPQWEYWYFFTAPDAPELMRNNLELFWEVNNGNHPSAEDGGRDTWMREMFCVKDGMRDYMEQKGKWSNRRVPLKDYPDGEEQKRRYIERMSRDGFEGPVNYYHSLKNNTMLEEEKWLCEKDESGNDRRVIDVPLLYIGQTGDWVCRTDLMADSKEFVADLEEKVVDAGHWCLYENPDAIADVLSEWLVRRFPIATS